MVSEDRLQMNGEVISAIKDIFKVQINENYMVTCTLSGKIRQNAVRVLVGDNVTVEISALDTSRGRIIFRNRT
jgi:translation initiation factor IF-1